MSCAYFVYAYDNMNVCRDFVFEQLMSRYSCDGFSKILFVLDIWLSE
jgi:hypothetical protein